MEGSNGVEGGREGRWGVGKRIEWETPLCLRVRKVFQNPCQVLILLLLRYTYHSVQVFPLTSSPTFYWVTQCTESTAENFVTHKFVKVGVQGEARVWSLSVDLMHNWWHLDTAHAECSENEQETRLESEQGNECILTENLSGMASRHERLQRQRRLWWEVLATLAKDQMEFSFLQPSQVTHKHIHKKHKSTHLFENEELCSISNKS